MVKIINEGNALAMYMYMNSEWFVIKLHIIITNN